MATILVADDETSIRMLVKHALTRAGHSVLEASNGLEAVAVFRSYANAIDVVVIDMVMPVLDGAQATSRIRETRPGIPVICMSGYTDLEIPDGAAFLSKPFVPSALVALVAELT